VATPALNFRNQISEVLGCLAFQIKIILHNLPVDSQLTIGQYIVK